MLGLEKILFDISFLFCRHIYYKLEIQKIPQNVELVEHQKNLVKKKSSSYKFMKM